MKGHRAQPLPVYAITAVAVICSGLIVPAFCALTGHPFNWFPATTASITMFGWLAVLAGNLAADHFRGA